MGRLEKTSDVFRPDWRRSGESPGQEYPTRISMFEECDASHLSP